jgi:23S rRNA pseudouridine2605 synthase
LSGIRLNKLLASRGLASRRKCDELIRAGSVRVNGTVVREPGVRVEPDRDRVAVHGRPIPGSSALRYVMLHKPVGVLTTLRDPQRRPTVRGLLPPGPRLFPVGRLDADSSGLLLFTNDGDLAHHLTHPRYGVWKLYRVAVAAVPDGHQLRRLRAGVELERGVVSSPAEVRLRRVRSGRAVLDIALHEGRHRQVRRMCEAVGLELKALRRWGFGPLRLGQLPAGVWRDLSATEVARLKAAAARPGGQRPSWGVSAKVGVGRRPTMGHTAGRPGRASPGAAARGRGSRARNRVGDRKGLGRLSGG